MKIAIDFDGTCVTHEFPRVGKDVPGAVDTLRALDEAGHELTLFTMRSGAFLNEAVRWFTARQITLSGVQYAPNQTKWTSSNKCYAQLYIDDAAYGCPLIHDKTVAQRPYVDWSGIWEYVRNMDQDSNSISVL